MTTTKITESKIETFAIELLKKQGFQYIIFRHIYYPNCFYLRKEI
jgi:ribosomal protein S18 acetylase RimI-like enzyme